MATFGACQKSRVRLPYLLSLGMKGPVPHSSLIITSVQATQKGTGRKIQYQSRGKRTVPIACIPVNAHTKSSPSLSIYI